MIGSFILLFILLGCSAIMSGSETALFGLSRLQVYQCQRSKHRLRRRAAELLHKPRQLLLTILIANTTVNIFIFAVSYIISEHLSQHSVVLATAWGIITVFLVIILGEVLAKTSAASVAYRIAPWVAAILSALEWVLWPVRQLLDVLLIGWISRLIIGKPEVLPETLTIDELKSLLRHSAAQGIIGREETDMLQEVVALATIKIRSIMIPRVDMAAFDIRQERTQFLEMLRQKRLSKLPVYSKDPDHMLGLIYARDVYLNPRAKLTKLIQPAQYVPEQMTADRLLAHFRRTRTQLAIVVDEYGGVRGLVTLEDVTEQIVGDIGQAGKETAAIEEISPTCYRLEGDLNVQPLYEAFGIARQFPRVTTLGGLIAAILGRFPTEGDHLELGNVMITVEQMSGNRVQRARVELLEDEAP